MPTIAITAPQRPNLFDSLLRHLPFFGPRTNGHDAESRHAAGAVETSASRAEWIARATAVCEAAARGDFEVRILRCHEGAEIEHLTRAINDLLDRTEAFVREAGAPLEAANDERFYRRVVLRGMLGIFRRTSETINHACQDMARNHAALSEAAENRRSLADQFEVSVQKVVAVLVTSAATANVAVKELAAAAGSAEAAARAAAEAPPISEKRPALPTPTPASAAPGKTAKNQPSLKAAAGRELNTVVAELVEASQRIGGVVKLISQIAAQTNLLALNATIEAARAGEIGRGFGVVANEVKSLSQQTAKATDQIRREITAVRVSAQSTAELVGSMSRRIAEMSEISSQVSAQAADLSGSVDNFLRTIRT